MMVDYTHWHVQVEHRGAVADHYTHIQPFNYNKEQAEKEVEYISENIFWYPEGNTIRDYPSMFVCSGMPGVCPHTTQEFLIYHVTENGRQINRDIVPICLHCLTLWFNMEVPNCHCG